jgi:hypothetical protein
MPHDSVHPAEERGWLITPRALTSLATAVSLVYVLHQPVRYVMHVAATVDALTARITALEGEVARERERRDAADAELAAVIVRTDSAHRPSATTAR